MHKFDIILLDKVLGHFLVINEFRGLKVSNINDKIIAATCFTL